MNVLDSQTGLWCRVAIMTYELGFVFAALHDSLFKKRIHVYLMLAFTQPSCLTQAVLVRVSLKHQLYFDWPTSRSLLRGTAQWPVLPALHEHPLPARDDRRSIIRHYCCFIQETKSSLEDAARRIGKTWKSLALIISACCFIETPGLKTKTVSW